jgi:hypothetical protein
MIWNGKNAVKINLTAFFIFLILESVSYLLLDPIWMVLGAGYPTILLLDFQLSSFFPCGCDSPTYLERVSGMDAEEYP